MAKYILLILLSLSIFSPISSFADIVVPPSTPSSQAESEPNSHIDHLHQPTSAFADVVTSGLRTRPQSSGDFAVFLVSLTLTLIVEFCVVYLLSHFVFRIAAPFSKILIAGTVPSIITLSFIYFSGLISLATLPIGLPAIEIGVVIVEAILIQRFLGTSWKRAVIISFLANFVTFVFGVLGLPLAFL